MELLPNNAKASRKAYGSMAKTVNRRFAYNQQAKLITHATKVAISHKQLAKRNQARNKRSKR